MPVTSASEISAGPICHLMADLNPLLMDTVIEVGFQGEVGEGQIFEVFEGGGQRL